MTTTTDHVTTQEAVALAGASAKIAKARAELAEIDPHRSIALAVTKLDEAEHWLSDFRKHGRGAR